MRWHLETLEIARKIVDVLESKKGEDILLLDIDEVSDFTDFFVICSGTSDRQLDTLADEIREVMEDMQRNETYEYIYNGDW